jgi:hypothetical protein
MGVSAIVVLMQLGDFEMGTRIYDHIARTTKTVRKTFKMLNGQKPKIMKVNLFPWEETAEISNSNKKWFGIK